jgi:hypothetical protein
LIVEESCHNAQLGKIFEVLVRDLHDDLAGQLLSVIEILLGGHDHIPHLRTEKEGSKIEM